MPTNKRRSARKRSKSGEDLVDANEDHAQHHRKGKTSIQKQKEDHNREIGKLRRRKGTTTVYTPSQLLRYQELLEELKSHTLEELKEMLRKNDQRIVGHKDELIARIADCKVLGRIQHCPRCKEGKLTFDHHTGVYRCPGYRDNEEEEFEFCNKKYAFDEIKREPWID
eukprot:TRINITY_DN9655_c0_g2_i2.p1 TRINITY_DN9655_c0_g2~~TRINITY_DN9655_c0_g2_i2.p1  ORF type:complete len:168 (-),score=25.46 TRINITY_DN9655_c0_g2_i2:413-916(-)